MAYTTSKEYDKVIYSGSATHKLSLSFNGVEVVNPDRFCERIVAKKRAIKNGNKGFYIDNFQAQTLECTFYNLDLSIVKEPVKISIGTLVNGVYEYVPLGTFNIQDEPTNDRGRTTLKLIDNADKFNFDYNAKPLIDQNGGRATKGQIWNDIHQKANVETTVTNFIGWNDYITTYDNTIKARQYLSKLAESDGSILMCNRDGKTQLIGLNELNRVQIPLSVVSEHDIGELFKVSKVVYEDGIVKYESGNNQNDTLFISADNMFVNSQEHLDLIYNKINGFELNSMRLGRMYGNPRIDSYDIIELVDDYKTDKPIIAKTLATHDLIYNGTLSATYETKIEKGDKSENHSLRQTPELVKKWAMSEVDKANAKIKIQAGEINNANEKINTLEITSNETKSTITNIEKDLSSTNAKIDGVSASFNDFKDNEYIQSIKGLQDQIDGAIQFWNGQEIPTLNNYPANEWISENDKINHIADIYTVIEDINGEMKQGKSYRFDKVQNVWQWIELTDNELSAVQKIAQDALNKANANEQEVGVLKQTTSELKQSDTELKASVTSIEKQMITEISTSGSNIQIDDGANAPFIDFSVDGKSYQETSETSPSPDFPSEIESVGYENLFDISKLSSTHLTEDFGIRNNGDGTLTIKTEVHGYSGRSLETLQELCPDLKPNKEYVLSANSTGTNKYIYIISTKTIWYFGKAKTLTQEDLNSYLYFYASGKYTQCVISNIQLEKGTTPHNYIPYGKYGLDIKVNDTSTQLILPTQLKSIDNIQDKLVKRDGTWGIEKIINKIELTGNETWQHFDMGNGQIQHYFNKSDLKYIPQTKNIMSNEYQQDIIENRTNKNNIIYTFTTGIALRDDRYKTVDTYKEYIKSKYNSGNPVIVQYELETPTFIPLDQENQDKLNALSTIKGTNNITTTDKLEPNMNLTYVTDTNFSGYVTSINKVEESITSQGKTLSIISKNIDSSTGEIREITTTNGFTFNNKGLNIYTDENSYNTLIDNQGTYYKDGDSIVSQTTRQGSIIKDLSEQGQHRYAYDSIKDDYAFIEEIVEVNGEKGYATFYNWED